MINNRERILVTGSDGFVGVELVPSLRSSGFSIKGTQRSAPDMGDEQCYQTGDIGADTAWQKVLSASDIVIHLANKAHDMSPSGSHGYDEFYRVNVLGTVNLAKQAVEAGVKRFIYLSSIKVNGDVTPNGAFTHSDTPSPVGYYAQSKLAAEQGLKEVCKGTDTEWVIIRPPLVYGPKVKGNLEKLTHAIDKGWPLPLGSISNRRDMISLKNLIDLVRLCISHPNATGQTFLCSDNCPVSTPQLIEYMYEARDKKNKLFPMPGPLLSAAAKLFGKSDAYLRLASDMRIDIKHTQETLDWVPPFTLKESICWAFRSEQDCS